MVLLSDFEQIFFREKGASMVQRDFQKKNLRLDVFYTLAP